MDEITRTEKFLRACIDGEPCALKPLTRVEKLLAELNDKLAGGPSEVVILPETEMAYDESDKSFYLTTPWTVEPVAGGMYVVTYNGVDYECESLVYAVEGAPDGMVLMGNASIAGQSGGNADAPFCLLCIPNGMGMGSMLMNTDGATSVTLSIVQTEGAASGGESAGGGIVVATCTIQNDGTIASADKTYAELLAAHNAGKYVLFKATNQYATMVLPLVTHMTYGNEYLAFGMNIDTQKLTAKAALLYYADGKIEYTSA